MPAALDEKISARVTPGRWAVGVSGGADSVALLRLLGRRGDLFLHVVHLDHQTRGPESDGDARFVQTLAAQLNLPCTIGRRDEVEARLTDLPANPSSRYRTARIALFRDVVNAHCLQGVVLAHHSDDRAETILLRLLRGSGPAGLAPIEASTRVGGLLMLRPLLDVPRVQLRAVLGGCGQTWREDDSNASDHYLRNRVRRWLADQPALVEHLLALGDACAALRGFAQAHAPRLNERFCTADLAGLPSILADASARRWLADRGVPRDQIGPGAIRRLLTMATDAGSAAKVNFPGRIVIRRRGGEIFVDGPPP